MFDWAPAYWFLEKLVIATVSTPVSERNGQNARPVTGLRKANNVPENRQRITSAP